MTVATRGQEIVEDKEAQVISNPDCIIPYVQFTDALFEINFYNDNPFSDIP